MNCIFKGGPRRDHLPHVWVDKQPHHNVISGDGLRDCLRWSDPGYGRSVDLPELIIKPGWSVLYTNAAILQYIKHSHSSRRNWWSVCVCVSQSDLCVTKWFLCVRLDFTHQVMSPPLQNHEFLYSTWWIMHLKSWTFVFNMMDYALNIDELLYSTWWIMH